MNFARDILPLLIAGGGMAAVAKSGLLGGNNPLTPKELEANNQIWDRLGRGASASPNAMGPEMAQPKPANPLAGSAPMSPAFNNPDIARAMPANLAGGPMMAQFPNLVQPQNQAPIMSAGLLGRPDEKSQEDFLKAQLYGNQPQKPVMTAGGSATQQSNPFLYASLYNNNRQVQ